MMRSFLAIDFPEKEKKILAGYSQTLRPLAPKVKWVSPQQMHVTLKFFGDLPQETIEKISTALPAVTSDFERFSLTLKGIGAFPNRYRPRVIWVGLGGETEALKTLQGKVENALLSLGIPGEDRPFQPHLTLGRNKIQELNEPLSQRLAQWPEKETDPFEVDALILYRSDLKPTGPLYTKLGQFPLSLHAPRGTDEG
jgi:RNA 2',3'-cyclic 3'-phosphodiesterase